MSPEQSVENLVGGEAQTDGMVIALIHWKIKPDTQSLADFENYWKGSEFEDISGLGGEFLSRPIPPEELPFKKVNADLISDDYRTFINVAIWKDWQTFYEQVGKKFNDDKPPESFEFERRTRTILTPQEWRLGHWQLPPGTIIERDGK